jgi:NAD(P)-dependent dehydrogenase (short-subunit alcohol dehydrogenase family)
MGVDIAKAALATGHSVAATGRDPEAVKQALGDHSDLLTVALDVASFDSAKAATHAAAAHFRGIDVLVNNAGNFYAGYFEELTPEQVEAQIDVNLFGPMNVTRAVLPLMRKQRSGHVVTLSSLAGIVGGEFASAYAASKFGLEGWMEALHEEIAPFGVHTTIVEPGYFRTELLQPASTTWAAGSIDDYAERTAAMVPAWQAMNGQQQGDPAKFAAALVQIVDQEPPPLRWVAGADAVAAVEQKAKDLLAHVDAYRDLSTSLAFDAVQGY